MTIEKEQREKWRALCEAATAAPWKYHVRDIDTRHDDDTIPPDWQYITRPPNEDLGDALISDIGGYDGQGITLTEDDYAFIAEGRQAMPQLIDEVEAQETVIDEALKWAEANDGTTMIYRELAELIHILKRGAP